MGEVTFAKQFLTALESRPARLSSDHVVDPKTYPAQPAFILPRMPQPKRKPASSIPSEATPDAAPPASPPTTTTTTTTPQQQPSATVTLKPTRPTPATPAYTHAAPLPLATTSVHDLKALYARAHPGVATDRIKVLWARKPVGDTKTLRDVLGHDTTTTTTTTAPSSSSDSQAIEFSIMILGGGSGGTPTAGTPAVSTPERVASPPVAVPTPPDAAPVAAAPTQTEVEMGEAPVPEAPGEAAEVLRTDAFWTDLTGFLVQRLRDEGAGERLAGVFREAWQKEAGSTS